MNNLTSGTRFAGPEEAKVFEVGVKGSFERFAFNLAVFDQVIEGFQSNAFTGTGFALANAGEQSTRGLEIDTTWNPIDPLTLTLAATFLDPNYDSFTGSAGGDITGTTPSGIPRTALSVGFNYDFTVANDWDAYVRSDYQYSSDTDFFDSVNPASGAGNPNLLVAQSGFDRKISLLNASLGMENGNGLAVSLWSRNLLDEEFVTTAFPSVAQAGSISGYPNQPRTYGVTVRKSF